MCHLVLLQSNSPKNFFAGMAEKTRWPLDFILILSRCNVQGLFENVSTKSIKKISIRLIRYGMAQLLIHTLHDWLLLSQVCLPSAKRQKKWKIIIAAQLSQAFTAHGWEMMMQMFDYTIDFMRSCCWLENRSWNRFGINVGHWALKALRKLIHRSGNQWVSKMHNILV